MVTTQPPLKPKDNDYLAQLSSAGHIPVAIPPAEIRALDPHDSRAVSEFSDLMSKDIKAQFIAASDKGHTSEKDRQLGHVRESLKEAYEAAEKNRHSG